MCRRILGIDPGDNTGWAFFKNGSDSVITGTIRIPAKMKKLVHADQIWFLSSRLNQILRTHKPLVCYIEGVTIWTGSLKSITSASRGNLIKLAYLVGSYMNMCNLNGVGVRIVTPQEWKGQMSKDVVARRVYRVMQKTFDNSHITDAVGIGLHALDKL